MNSVKFEHQNYQIRQVDIENSEIRNIASTTLNKRLINAKGSYTSEEARYIDEQIYFFVEPDILDLNDLALKQYVIMNCQ